MEERNEKVTAPAAPATVPARGAEAGDRRARGRRRPLRGHEEVLQQANPRTVLHNPDSFYAWPDYNDFSAIEDISTEVKVKTPEALVMFSKELDPDWFFEQPYLKLLARFARN